MRVLDLIPVEKLSQIYLAELTQDELTNEVAPEDLKVIMAKGFPINAYSILIHDVIGGVAAITTGGLVACVDDEEVYEQVMWTLHHQGQRQGIRG